MSLGAAFQWPQYPTAQAVERLTRKGIVVAVSAGNSGEAGEFATGAPGVGAAALTVASFENSQIMHTAFMDPQNQPMAFIQMIYSPDPPTSGQSAQLVDVGLGTTDADFRNPDGTSKVTGKVALISRGVISFQEKSLRSKKHGAVQAIIYNNAPGLFTGTLQTEGNYIPTLGISQADGQRLKQLMQAGPVRLTWSAGMHLFDNPLAGTVSDFSSWGPAPDLAIKPEVTAPGGSIYSTYPVEQGSYATISGTSMASPHVAGAAALVLQARKEMFDDGAAKVKATAVRTLLINTAQPRTEGPDSASLYPVHRQGGGLIDVWRAISAEQRVLPEKIAMGEVEAGTVIDQPITMENLSDDPQTYRFSVVGAQGQAAVSLAGATTLTVGPRQMKKTTVKLTVPGSLAEGSIFSGWIAVRNSAGAVVAHVPYLGFLGDYQAASALDPLGYDFPWLARLEGIFLYKSDQVTIRPNCGCDAANAYVIFSLARQVPELKLEIWDAATGRKWGHAFRASYLGRSAGGFEIYGWDGTNDKGRPVAEGTYILRLMALRPLGDASNPDHWDVWNSGKVTVQYD